MSKPDSVGEVINLKTRSEYRPDLAALARRQLTAARNSRDLSVAEFAEMLRPLLGWPVTQEAVTAWETTAVPPGDVLVAAGLISHAAPTGPADASTEDLVGQLIGDRFSDVTAVYASRSEFTSNLPPTALFDEAKTIWVAGLSLNLLCQHYPVPRIRDLLERGTTIRCLFLDPHGEAMKAREAEENYPLGHLSALTVLNIQTLQQRVQDHLSPDARTRLQIAVYDETIRFNLIIVDSRLCIAQPYLPGTRGGDSPTFLVQRRWASAGLFPVFEQMFTALWERKHLL